MPESDKVDIYLPFYVGDYLRDTSDLSTEEHGAYLLLLFHAWPTGGRITSDQRRLARIAKVVDLDRWREIWDRIGEFWKREGDHLVQGKMGRVREWAMGKRQSASDRGKEGARAKAQKRAEEEARRQAELRLNGGSAGAGGSTNGKHPDPDPKSESDPNTRSDPEGARAPASLVWPGEYWLGRFATAFEKVRGQSYVGTADDTAVERLQVAIARLPQREASAAQQRADEMFREYLTSDARDVVRARHNFVFFVTRWGDLRLSRKVLDAAPPDARCDHHRGDRNKGQLRPDGPMFTCVECKRLDGERRAKDEVRAGDPAEISALIADVTKRGGSKS